MHPDSGGDTLLGHVLEGRYRVDAYLARGGMSTVYEGVDLRLDRAVAIKVMTAQYAADPTFLKRFEREARAAARLDNPHVVGVYDQGRDGEHVFLIMELVDGGTLRDLIHDEGRLPLRTTLSVLEPVLDALASAHLAGLVHRDVKPENVLISTRGEVKVADFGLVRAVTSTTMATGDVILGTVAYLSPEQVETGSADERSDVYSAGLVAFEMLTGSPPFTGDNALSVAYQHVHSDVPPIAGATEIPAQLAAVLDMATEREPLARPANAGEFLQRLRGARLQVGVSLGPVPVPRSAARRPARGRAGATAVQPTGNRPDRGPVAPVAPSTAQLQRRRTRRIRLIATALVLALAAGATVLGIWLANRWTSAPDLKGQPEATAIEAAQSAGLKPALVTRHDNAVPSGRIAAMDPPADTRQRTGADLTLVVSAGRPVVPTIKDGTPVADAQAAIRAADLRPVINASRDVYDAVLPEGTVVSTEPAAGTSALIDAPVLLIVSKGPEPVPIPEVAGKATEDAQNKLIVAGFALGPPITRFDATVPAGTVLGTEPALGERRKPGSSVSLILADSKTVPIPPPGTVDAAAAELRAEGFTVTIGDPVFDAEVVGGNVVGISPAPGSRIDPSAPDVTLIGSNAVTMPPVMGLSVGQAKSSLGTLDLQVRVRSLFGSDSSTVTGQDPEPGTLVEPGSTVRIDAWP